MKPARFELFGVTEVLLGVIEKLEFARTLVDGFLAAVAGKPGVLLVDVDKSAALQIENRHPIEALIEQLAQRRPALAQPGRGQIALGNNPIALRNFLFEADPGFERGFVLGGQLVQGFLNPADIASDRDHAQMSAELETECGDQAVVGAAVLAAKDGLHVPDQAGSFELFGVTAGILGVIEKLDFARTCTDDFFAAVAGKPGVLLVGVDESAGLQIENRHPIEVLIEKSPQHRPALAQLGRGQIALGNNPIALRNFLFEADPGFERGFVLGGQLVLGFLELADIASDRDAAQTSAEL